MSAPLYAAPSDGVEPADPGPRSCGRPPGWTLPGVSVRLFSQRGRRLPVGRQDGGDLIEGLDRGAEVEQRAQTP